MRKRRINALEAFARDRKLPRIHVIVQERSCEDFKSINCLIENDELSASNSNAKALLQRIEKAPKDIQYLQQQPAPISQDQPPPKTSKKRRKESDTDVKSSDTKPTETPLDESVKKIWETKTISIRVFIVVVI